MQKIGLQFQKLAEIRTFLENWPIAGLRHKKRDISANFVNLGPFFCMRGQFYMFYKKSIATMGQKSLFHGNLWALKDPIPRAWDDISEPRSDRVKGCL